jgi:uncharacterized linocin/CFP29 family protein
MNDLHRELAPLTPRAWQVIEQEARRVLSVHLAGRRLVDFEGPVGWEASSLDLGRAEAIGSPPRGVELRARAVRPMLELRVAFALARSEVEAIDRGAEAVDLGALVEASRRLAAAEDGVLFHGCSEAGVPGMLSAAEPKPVAFPTDRSAVPAAISEALDRLRGAGVAGPYALALGAEEYASLAAATEEGFPLLRHVRDLVEGPCVWAPALRGGLLVSRRGGDFAMVCGRDAAIGYDSHDGRSIRLYLTESFGVRIPGPEACVPLPRDA